MIAAALTVVVRSCDAGCGCGCVVWQARAAAALRAPTTPGRRAPPYLQVKLIVFVMDVVAFNFVEARCSTVVYVMWNDGILITRMVSGRNFVTEVSVCMHTGFFNPYSAHGSYYPCPTGTFASAPGSSVCTACPAGKFSAAQLGATACSSNCTLSVLPGAASCAPGGCAYCNV